MTDRIEKSERDWRSALTPEQYHVARERGTEPAFSGRYWNHKDVGVYHCVCCGLKLFRSDTKYDSGSGWPSFFRPVHEDGIATDEDLSHGMRRVEARCPRCDAHLGHVFPDGPAPTGTRYCINSASLDFKSED